MLTFHLITECFLNDLGIHFREYLILVYTSIMILKSNYKHRLDNQLNPEICQVISVPMFICIYGHILAPKMRTG